MLITGATGTFGKVFVRLLLQKGEHDRICVYSRSEYKQAVMREEFNNDPRLRFFIGDVRDLPRLARAMNGCDEVVHAAALKRIEVGVYCPDEMVKTNVLGTMNVIEACRLNGIKNAVLLSSDKAYQPVSAYGHTKALGEALFHAANSQDAESGRFATVRYGNVAGSTGSVIPFWRSLDPKKEWPITDPDCTRFWMHPSQAAQLVYQALTDTTKDFFIPILGAYRLGDLAKAMGCKKLGEPSGLPVYEKLTECMSDELCSDTAKRMTIKELKEALRGI